MDQEDSKETSKQVNNKINKSKRKRIKSDFNNRQYIPHIFHKLKREYPDLDFKTITKIISKYFDLTQDDLSKGNTVSLGNMLGDLYVIKIKRKVYINEKGELINTLPIDQNATNILWKQKPELKGKTFVRHLNEHSDGFLFKLKHYIFRSPIKNKIIYTFKFTKKLRTRLSNNIKNKEVHAYEIKNKDE